MLFDVSLQATEICHAFYMGFPREIQSYCLQISIKYTNIPDSRGFDPNCIDPIWPVI